MATEMTTENPYPNPTKNVKKELQTMYKLLMTGLHDGEEYPMLSTKNTTFEMVQCNTFLMLKTLTSMSKRIKDLEGAIASLNTPPPTDQSF